VREAKAEVSAVPDALCATCGEQVKKDEAGNAPPHHPWANAWARSAGVLCQGSGHPVLRHRECHAHKVPCSSCPYCLGQWT